jgi:hypothetical protein
LSMIMFMFMFVFVFMSMLTFSLTSTNCFYFHLPMRHGQRHAMSSCNMEFGTANAEQGNGHRAWRRKKRIRNAKPWKS